jgi:hypothetical protein
MPKDPIKWHTARAEAVKEQNPNLHFIIFRLSSRGIGPNADSDGRQGCEPRLCTMVCMLEQHRMSLRRGRRCQGESVPSGRPGSQVSNTTSAGGGSATTSVVFAIEKSLSNQLMPRSLATHDLLARPARNKPNQHIRSAGLAFTTTQSLTVRGIDEMSRGCHSSPSLRTTFPQPKVAYDPSDLPASSAVPTEPTPRAPMRSQTLST